MKIEFLVAAIALVALPAYAITPSNANGANTTPGTMTDNPAAQTTGSDSDVFTAPFDRERQERTELRANTDRSRNHLTPPRMDASGVPDPRI